MACKTCLLAFFALVTLGGCTSAPVAPSTRQPTSAESQVFKTSIDGKTYFVTRRYDNLSQTQEVSAACDDGDKLVMGGCDGPIWLPITGMGPTLANELSSWTCRFAPLQKIDSRTELLAINPSQDASRVNAVLSVRAICRKR